MNKQVKYLAFFLLSIFFQIESFGQNTFQKACDAVKLNITTSIVDINKMIDGTDSLWTITADSVYVGSLLSNNDYHNYYRNNAAKKIGVDLWVFLLEDIKNKFGDTEAINSDNMCMLLGLDITPKRDTIIVFQVASNKLFRPAYNPDITDKKMYQVGDQAITGTDTYIINWFQYQQRTNIYPWTRKGYTYDWRGTVGRIGASEFILKKESTYRNLTCIPLTLTTKKASLAPMLKNKINNKVVLY